jgi:hypothetical protein
MICTIIFEAIAEDMTHASDGMGRGYTTEESLGLFTTRQAAQKACVRHYKAPIPKWKKEGTHYITSDLGWVMYHVRVRAVQT